jgi:hypothetical protein
MDPGLRTDRQGGVMTTTNNFSTERVPSSAAYSAFPAFAPARKR